MMQLGWEPFVPLSGIALRRLVSYGLQQRAGELPRLFPIAIVSLP